MKCRLVPEHPVTDAAAKAATGKTLTRWYALLDEEGGPKQGRRALGNYLLEKHGVDPWWCTTIIVEYENRNQLTKKDGLPEGYAICATKTIGCDLPHVYRAWTESKVLNQWFGSAVEAEVDDDGTWCDGDGASGSYERVRPKRDLRFTWVRADFRSPSRVDVQFQDKGSGKAGLVVNHSRLQTRGEADGMRAAWGDALGRLKSLLEA